MKKRLTALLLSVLMVVSVLPISALPIFAAEPTLIPEEIMQNDNQGDGIILTKFTRPHLGPDGKPDGTVDIYVQSYTTGQVVQTTTTTPTDIVLVLDLSGSMDKKQSSTIVSTYVEDYATETSYDGIYVDYYYTGLGTIGTRYVKLDDETYVKATRARNDANGHEMWTYDDGNSTITVYPVIEGNATPEKERQFNYPVVQFYELTTHTVEGEKKIDLLKDAVDTFIADTKALNDGVSDASKKHRIAIVKFGTADYYNDNNLIAEGNHKNNNNYNYTEVVKNFTVVDDTVVNGVKNIDALTNAMNSLTPGGATSVDYGMNLAKRLFDAQPESTMQGRNKVVIVLTDGSPTHSDDYESAVAGSAINYAKTLKDEGVIVYTISVEEGADATQLTNNDSNRFMHYLSSNYPSASYRNDNINAGTGDVSAGYYLTTGSTHSLSMLFAQINESIGAPKIELGEEAILIDEVSEFFTVNDDVNAVKAYTVDRLVGAKWSDTLADGPTPIVNGSTVYVRGFDYNANYVSTEPRTVGGADFYGRMLMLVINVVPDYQKIDTHAAEIVENGGKVATNNETAHVMSGTSVIAEVESPTIALNKVTYKVDGANYATYYRLEGGENELITAPTKVGHTFSGWSSTDVTIDNGKFEMIGSDVTIVGTFTANTHSVSYEYVGLEIDGRPELPTKQENVAYGTTVTVAQTPTLEGYDFVGWYPRDAALGTGNITSFSMPDHDVVLLGRFVPATGVAYKVEHYTETFTDGEFELKDTENLTGTTGETATAVAKNYEGFTFDNTVTGTKVSGEILADGSLTLKLYYTRNSYEVTYEYVGTAVPSDANPAGVIGTPIATYTATYKYGETVTVKADATANGYTFTGWYSTGGTVTNDTESFTMPDHAVTLRGYFSARTDVAYMVEHYFENANDTSYTKNDALTETFTNGITGATVTATPLNVQGFTFDGDVTGTVQSGTVTADDPDTAEDETLVLKLYYKRNTYTVSYGYEGVLPTTTFAPSVADLAGYTESVKWGATVDVEEGALADRYEFHGWYRDGDPSHTKIDSFEMPMHNVKLLGYFEKLEDPSYTVKHFFEDANGSYIEGTSYEETFKAPEGEEVTANPLKVDGYKFNQTETDNKNIGTVLGDGSLVLEVYYERESYTVTYLYDNTVPGASDLSKAPYETKLYKWGKSVDVAADATAPGYTFIGWYRNNDAQKAEITSFEMPMHNVELAGMFTANTNTAYSVEHYFENVAGTDWVINDTLTQNLTGITGIEVTATPIAVAGFTYNATKSAATRSALVAGDGSTTLKLYYDRNDYTVNYVYTVAPAGTTPPASHTELYDKEVTVKNAADIAGYTFSGWTPSVNLNINGGTLLGGGTFKMPDSNVTFTGSYSANDYNYRVEHYVETDNGYELYGTGETRVGKMDTFVSAAAIIIKGYTYDADVTVHENANNGIAIGSGEDIDFTNSDRTTLHAKIVDDTLVLAFYYTRNEHKVTYVIEGTTVPEGVTAPTEATVSFGTPVDVHGGYTEAGYKFSGWTTDDVTVSGGKFYMPDNDVVFTGSFTALEVGYTIKYWQESLDDTNFEKEYRGKKYNEVVTDRVTGLTAITGHYVSAYPDYIKTYEGFNADPVQTEYHGYVKGDGSLVLNVYYDRLTYDVTYIYVGYMPDDAPAIPASYNKTGVKYGATLDVEAKMADYGDRKFEGWHSTDVDITTATSFTMPAKNVTIYGTYVPADVNDYTVTYFVDGEEYKQFTVKPGEVHDIIDIPTGLTEFIGWSDPYNVEEGVHFDTTDNEFIMPWSDVEIRGEFKSITPIILKGELQITKELNAPEDFAKDEFSFGIYEVVGSTVNHVKNVTVKAGETIKFALTIGKYLVVENDAEVDGYTLETTVDDSDAIVTITKGDVVEITFTNTYTEVMLEKDDHFGYIVGYPDGMVRPEALITRAEVVTIFFRMMTETSRNHYWATTNNFSDVADSSWYNTAISTLAKAGVLEGYGDGTFHPNGTITRAELIKIATSFYNTTAGKNSEFSDIKDHWAEDFIEEAYALGFVEGYGDGTFHPDAPVTRAETMKIVNRTLERAPHKDHLLDTMTVWPDNMDKSKWYYAEVQEATNSHDYEWITEDQKACESWTQIFPIRDWAALELVWKQEHDGE